MADRRLQVFHAVAKQLSFTKAAETLFMTQPAVTFQVKQLEEHLNVRLFDRGHGRISLTPAGRLALEYAERILGDYAELQARLAEMSNQVEGPLSVGASATVAEFMLPRVLAEFNASYPQVRTRLTVGNSETIENRVAERSLDVGLVETEVHLSVLAAEVCCQDEFQVICAPGHPLAGKTSVTPDTLQTHAFIAREPDSGSRELTDQYFRNAGLAPERMNILMELGSPEALKGVVSTGLGFAVVSRSSFAKECQLGQLVAIPLNPPLARTLSLVYPQERFHPQVLRTFVDFTKQKLKEYFA